MRTQIVRVDIRRCLKYCVKILQFELQFATMILWHLVLFQHWEKWD